MSCWGLVLRCLFVCSHNAGQLVREGCSASSWRAGLLPSLAAWPRGAAIPGEYGARPASGLAVAQGRKVPGGKGHLPRRTGMEQNAQILKCCD